MSFMGGLGGWVGEWKRTYRVGGWVSGTCLARAWASREDHEEEEEDCRLEWVGGWVGGLGCVEGEEAVRMSYSTLGFGGWVGEWVGGLTSVAAPAEEGGHVG